MERDILNSPSGMRSYLPDVALIQADITEKIMKTFTLGGYQRIITPTLEYLNSLTVGMGQKLQKELYKFIDYEGNILALRPEMTAPIARTVASRLEEIILPQRFSYEASVFRYAQPQIGKNREICQTGVEYIGDNSPLADAEVIILAIEALIKVGIKEFKIDLGHVSFLNGIIKKFDLSYEKENQIKTFLVKRDLVGLKLYIQSLQLNNKDLLLQLPTLRGKKEVLTQAEKLINNQLSQQALINLSKIYNYINEYGLGEYINFDLSLIRGFGYYTGLVFEGFTEKLGYTICGGGRYDNLIEQYIGEKIPAVGFAIGVERVRLALEKQATTQKANKIDIILAFPSQVSHIALSTVKNLRKKGLVTVMSETEELTTDYINLCKNKNIAKLVSFINYLEKKEIEIIDLNLQKKQVVEAKEGWEKILCP